MAEMIVEYPLHIVHEDDLQIIMDALHLGKEMTVATLTPHAKFREALEVCGRISWNTSVRTERACKLRKEMQE